MYKSPEIPIPLLRLLAYKRNLPPKHPAHVKLNDEIAPYSSGHFGEKTIDYYINLIPNQTFSAIHTLRIPVNFKYFQMDTLLKTNKFLIIVEVKNHTGDIEIDHDFGTMTQNGTKSFQDPISQVENQTIQLKTWLRLNGYPPIPIENLVVFTNRNVRLIRTGTQEIDPRIISGYRLTSKLQEILNKYEHAPSYPQMNKIITHLKKANEPLDSKLMNKIGLTIKDLAPGVKCPQCSFSIMKRIYGNWLCPTCKHTDKQAHVYQIKDYYLIFGPTITNSQARYWLNHDSPYTIRDILKSSSIKKISDKRHTVHEIKFDYQKDFNYLLEYNKQNIGSSIKA